MAPNTIKVSAFLLAALAGGLMLGTPPAHAQGRFSFPGRSTGEYRDLTFDDIKFEMKKGDPFERSMLTEKIEKLNNTKIRIRGFILPGFQQKGITQFVLVRDNMECCFGPGAALYDCIMVDMETGKSTSFSVKPIAVEGVFEIRPYVEDGKHLAIYHLVGQAVK